MNKFEEWFLKRVYKREVRQGYDHPERIKNLYNMINDACRDEFYEDNLPTIRCALGDWFQDSLKELKQ